MYMQRSLQQFCDGWIKYVINLPRPKGSDLLPEFSDLRIGPSVNKSRFSDETQGSTDRKVGPWIPDETKTYP